MMNRRINDKMINMVTGAEVMITAINGEEVTFDDGTVLAKDKVNACFKFVSNDTPYPAPAAEVNGNEVVVDGVKVVTGIMKPIEVVATVPGAALILAEGKDSKKNLVRFDAVKGEFNHNAIAEAIDDVRVLYEKDGILVYAIVTENDRKVVDKDNDDEEAVVKDYADRVYVIKDGNVIGQFCNMNLDKHVKTIIADDGQIQLFFERGKKLDTREDTDGYDFYVVSDMDGVDLVEIEIVEEIDEETEEVTEVYTNSYCAHYGEVKRISQIHGGNGVMVVTGNGIHIYGRRHMAIGQDVLDAVAEHPILVRFTAAGGSHSHDTFVLSDDKYNTVFIRVERVGGPVGYVTKISQE